MKPRPVPGQQQQRMRPTSASEGSPPFGGRTRETQNRGRRNNPIWLWQAARFSAVGVLNTAVDAALYLALTRWLGLGGLRTVAKVISYAVGTVNSFYWNRSWTFQSRARVAATFVPFVLASLLALAINAGIMYLSLRLFDQYDLPALALATAVTLLWNFSVSKFLVFRR